MEFYVDFLGFTLDWEHRYEPDLPLYAQLSRSGLKLHLSEHYGDGTPGTVVYIRTENASAFFRELQDKKAKFARPSDCCEEATLVDPFGNILRFDGIRKN
jgi:uncharacterized glyoxalase superfamily protein PhnB